MMAESTINKMLLTILTLFTIISICIGASNLHLTLRGDVNDAQGNIKENSLAIDKNEDEIHLLQLSSAVGEAHYQAILTELMETKKELADLSIQNIKILEILSGFKVVE
jgi:hypothetical protein